MLAELAIASAAFSTVKNFVQEGKSIYDCGESIIKYFDAKSSLQKKVYKKGGNSNDLEEFMALEKIKEFEDELRELMIYTGRAGLWQDWMSFQGEAAERRKQDELDRRKARAAFEKTLYSWVMGILWFVIGSTVFTLIVYALLVHFGYVQLPK